MNAMAVATQRTERKGIISKSRHLHGINGYEKVSSMKSKESVVSLSQAGQLKNQMGNIQNTLVTYKRINVKFTSVTLDSFENLRNQKASGTQEKAIDLLFKMLTKNEQEYKELKDDFMAVFDEAKSLLNQEKGIKPLSFISSAASQVSEIAVQKTEISIEFVRIESQLEMNDISIGFSDPLILNVKGEGVTLTDVKNGALFDINGDGKMEMTAWVSGDNAFLVLDRNGNGKIDSGKEFFGDQNGAENGFKELAKYDANKDGLIDKNDPIFNKLKVYQDKNGNKKIDADELKTLDEAGILNLNLDYLKDTKKLTGDGSKLIFRGNYTTADGKKNDIVDALLASRKIPDSLSGVS